MRYAQLGRHVETGLNGGPIALYPRRLDRRPEEDP